MTKKNNDTSLSISRSAVRSNHPLRSFKYQRGDIVNLIYSLEHPSMEIKEFRKSTFIKCYVRESVDMVVFIHEGTQHVYPLSLVGVVEVSHERLK